MKEISGSDIIWREQFAKDFKSTKKLKDDKDWKQNYRDGTLLYTRSYLFLLTADLNIAYGVEMNGVVSITSMRPVKWTYTHKTRTITKSVAGKNK